MNTRIIYMYCNAHGAHRSVVLAGVLSRKQIKEIASLTRSDGFIPENAGLPNGEITAHDMSYDANGLWHEIEEEDIAFTPDPPTITMTAQEFYSRLQRTARAWDIDAAIKQAKSA